MISLTKSKMYCPNLYDHTGDAENENTTLEKVQLKPGAVSSQTLHPQEPGRQRAEGSSDQRNGSHGLLRPAVPKAGALLRDQAVGTNSFFCSKLVCLVFYQLVHPCQLVGNCNLFAKWLQTCGQESARKNVEGMQNPFRQQGH